MSEHPPIQGYELIRLLGRNGHLVYLARHSTTGQLAFLNFVHSSHEFGKMVAEKLRQQAKALEILDHPNIVRLIELRDAQDYGFFSAIEFVDGESLAEVVRRGHLPPPREVVRIARSVATALNYVHGKSIVYGRVRPEHILLDRTGHVFLTGFGEFVPINP
ncbi:MAG: serine/threonine protein kinase, partial [Pirellula sp.]